MTTRQKQNNNLYGVQISLNAINYNDELKAHQVIKAIYTSYDIKSNTVGAGFKKLAKKLLGYGLASDQRYKMVLPSIYKAMRFLYPSNKSLSIYLSHLRQVIKKTRSNDIYEYSKGSMFNLPANILDEMRTLAENKVKASNLNRTGISEHMIKTTMDKLIISLNPFDRLLALLLATGCRGYELIHLNQLDYLPKMSNHIKISNLAKKPEHAKITEITRPVVHFDAKAVVDLVKELRAELKGNYVIFNKAGQLSTSMTQNISKRTRKWFPAFTGRQKGSMMRKLYGQMAYKDNCGPSVNENIYLMAVFGHEHMDTSFNYSGVKLIPDYEGDDNLDSFKMLKSKRKKM